MRMILSASAMIFLSAFCFAVQQDSVDPIREELEKAKQLFDERIIQARSNFVDDIDKLIERTEGNTRLATEAKIAVVDELLVAKNAFLDSGTLPDSQQLRRSRSTLQSIERGETKRLREAFNKAAQSYDSAGDLDAAKVILEERDTFIRSGGNRFATKSISLLPLMDPRTHVQEGAWKMLDKVLYSEPGELARIRVPYDLPESYELRLRVERLSGASDFQVGLKSGTRSFIVVLDGWGASTSGISRVNGRLADRNKTTYKGQVFRNNQPATINVSVRPASIKVTVNGSLIISLQGTSDSLVGDTEIGKSFFFGVQRGASYRVLDAKLSVIRNQ